MAIQNYSKYQPSVSLLKKFRQANVLPLDNTVAGTTYRDFRWYMHLKRDICVSNNIRDTFFNRIAEDNQLVDVIQKWNCPNAHFFFKYENVVKSYFRLKYRNVALQREILNYDLSAKTITLVKDTKNKLDDYSCNRKSNTLKTIWMEYFKENAKAMNEMYIPIHATITVQHDISGYKGDIYYHSKLLKEFKQFRREFKYVLVGGTVNSETTYSKVNGYHTHLHIFAYIPKSTSINNLRILLNHRWKEITKNETNYNPINIQSLYYLDGKGKKVYYNRNFTIEQTLKSFKECIKYNLKLDCVPDLSLQQLEDFLKNTKYKRMFSRFGLLYGNKKLSISSDTSYYKQVTFMYQMKKAKEERFSLMKEFNLNEKEFFEIAKEVDEHNENIKNELKRIITDSQGNVIELLTLKKNIPPNEHGMKILYTFAES